MSNVRRRMKHIRFPFTRILLLATMVGLPAIAGASGSGQVVSQMADAPPETKIKMLRIIFNEVVGTAEELKTQFVAACNARQKALAQPAAQAGQGSAAPTLKASAPSKNLSKEATLAAFCVPAVRRGIESALTPNPAAASAPNPSIERTPPGKPGAASHVKR